MATSQLLLDRHAVDPLEQHQLEHDLLSSITAWMATRPTQQDLLSRIAQSLEHRCAISYAAVVLGPPEQRQVFPIQRVADERWARANEVASAVWQSGQLQVIPQQGVNGTRRAALVCVPILVGSDAIGTLLAEVVTENGWPLKEYARFLRTVGNLIALDVEMRRQARIHQQAWGGEHRDLKPGNAISHGDHGSPSEESLDQDERHSSVSLTSRVESLEREMIIEALRSTRGNVAAAARALSITPRIIRYKIKKLGIDSRRACEKQ
jgi:transcriptional regulator with GAF, ATPase, and Fis domain